MKVSTVLLLEDQPLVSWEVEDMLLEAGVGKVVVLPSCAEAEAWLELHSPDAAVLEMRLRDRDCSEVAEILVDRGIPFVVHTVRTRPSTTPQAVLLRGRWFTKPADPAELLGAIRAILPDGGGAGGRTSSSPARGSAAEVERQRR